MIEERKNIFINRELSWLKFNERVLEEAEDPRTPLAERLNFISIYCSNLDEFFMIRVGSLFDQQLIDGNVRDKKTGMTVDQQLEGIFSITSGMNQRLTSAYETIMHSLGAFDIQPVDLKKMSVYTKNVIEQYFYNEVLPLISPQIIDKQHPFPFFRNQELYVGLQLGMTQEQIQFGVIPVSLQYSRVFTFTDETGSGIHFALIEDIIMHFADRIFTKTTIQDKFIFRVTRNGDINLEEGLYDEDIDWRDEMEKLLKKRKKSSAVRLQLSTAIHIDLLQHLCSKLEIEEGQVIVESVPLDMSFVSKLCNSMEKEYPQLFYAALPALLPAGINPKISVMKQIASGQDLLLLYPFHSMKPFIDLLNEAAEDPEVLSIKITLYRVAQRSNIVAALMRAAENGKEVLVLVELRARFDEQNNIDWSKQLEDAGCMILYGVEDYKVHSKLMVITRKYNNKLEYITQIGTGNYNEKTSRFYTDLSLITSNIHIGLEAISVFQRLAISEFVEESNHLLVAPKRLKSVILEMMDHEIFCAKQGIPAEIFIKVNSISDKDMIDKMVEASQAGVKITLFVRGICCFKAGVSGYTDNIVIRSIVGRFLEHSRIYSFGVGHRQKIYLGSADWMTRNTEYRVEVATEILDEKIKDQIRYILQVLLKDNVKARQMDSNGNYQRMFHENHGLPIDSQLQLYEYYANQREEYLQEIESNPENLLNRLKRLFQK